MSHAMIRRETHSIWKTPVTMTLCTSAAVVLVVLLIHGRARFNGLRAGTQQRSFHQCHEVAPTQHQYIATCAIHPCRCTAACSVARRLQ